MDGGRAVDNTIHATYIQVVKLKKNKPCSQVLPHSDKNKNKNGGRTNPIPVLFFIGVRGDPGNEAKKINSQPRMS